MTKDQFIQKSIEEFREKFKPHPYGVFKDEVHSNPEYIPLTIENIEFFLTSKLTEMYEAGQDNTIFADDLHVRNEERRRGYLQALKDVGGVIEEMRIQNPKCYCKTNPEHNCGETSNETFDDVFTLLQTLEDNQKSV